MVRIKHSFIILGLFIVISGCAPIDGLDQEGNSEETTVAVETTEAPQPTTAIPEPTTVLGPQTLEANWVKITADALNVRREGNIEAERITKIYENQIYQVLDESKDSQGLIWFKLEAPDGIIGWVSSDYCIIGETYDALLEEE